VGEGGGDFDHLLIGDGQALDGSIWGEAEAEVGHGGGGFFSEGLPIYEAGFGSGVISGVDVLGDGEVGEGEGFLVDEGDAFGGGVFGIGKASWLAVEDQLPGGGAVDAGDDLGEGGFPGAVFAGDGVDFTGVEIEVDSMEYLDAAKGHFDLASGDEGFLHGIWRLPALENMGFRLLCFLIDWIPMKKGYP